MATNNAANTSSGALTLEKAASDLQTTYIGANTWSHGLDDNAGDAFKLSQNAALGTTDTFIMTTAGERTMPLQPAFLAYNSAYDLNVTGDGTVYTCEFDTEVFDQGGDYDNATDTFTAPVTGRYFFSFFVFFQAIGAAHTGGGIRLIVNGTDVYYGFGGDLGNMSDNGNNLTLSMAGEISLTAADTIIAAAVVTNSTKTVDIYGDATISRTRFSGYLVC